MEKECSPKNPPDGTSAEQPTPEAGAHGADTLADNDNNDALAAILKRASYRKRTECTHTAHSTIAQRDPNSAVSEDGFRLKKRATLTFHNPEWRDASMLDFMFENPLDGKFKDLAVVKQLLSDYPGMVRQVETSYCHYGYRYQKRTMLIGTLVGLTPRPACPHTPCRFLRRRERHPEQSAECGNQEKNSLPSGLIDSIMNSWIGRHGGRANRYLLIDVFSGWGSIETRVNERWPQVVAYANDIVPRAHTDINLDMSATSIYSPSSLLMFAIRKLWPDEEEQAHAHPGGTIGWLQQQKIAVLFHCSTPCRTYSTQALATHRIKGTAEPKTTDAERDDDMNAALISYFRRVVLTNTEHTRS